jgi:predicted phage terminase large subunit-like protein
MKSLSVNVFFPAWVWTQIPSKRFLTASYAESLTMRDNMKFRDIIMSPFYQENWGHMFQLRGDQNTKKKIENDKTGYRIATSIDGTGTGDGGDILLLDDPNNVKKTESKLIRDGVNTWMDTTWSTRRNDPETSSRILIQQRTHESDASGHILAKNNSEVVHLCLPMEYEPGRKCSTSIGWSDPREKEGELLWPERFKKPFLDLLKIDLGSYASAGQLQQLPSPKEGAILQRSYWRFYRALPPVEDWEMLYQSWDTSYKEKETNDYWASFTGFMCKGKLYILPDGYFKARMETPDGEQKIKSSYRRFNPHQVLIEDKASGQSLVQSIRRNTGVPVKGIKVSSDKSVRASMASPKIEAGAVLLPSPEHFEEASWVDEFIDNCAKFPNCNHDDDIDALTQLINHIWGKPMVSVYSLESNDDDIDDIPKEEANIEEEMPKPYESNDEDWDEVETHETAGTI